MEDQGEKPIKGLKKHGKQIIMSSSEKSFFKTFKTKRNSCWAWQQKEVWNR